MDAVWAFLLSFVNADKLAGWVRAGVAGLIGILIAKWPWLATIVSPDVQNGLAVAASGLVVGLWQHLVKTPLALLSAAATANPDAKIVVTSQSEANKLPDNVKGPAEVRVVPVGPIMGKVS